MEVPKISVVVPTYQGAKRIVSMLECLLAQEFRDFETIVVVDGSTDGTYELLQGMSWSIPIKIINQANRGRAGARNSGAKAARSPMVVFLDDDILFDDKLLGRFNALADAGHVIVGGSVYPVESARHDEFLTYSHYLNEKWSKGVLERGPLKTPFLNAANSMVKRSVFMDLGMFDERLRDAEDFDLAVRAFEKNIAIFFEPDLIAGHRLKTNFLEYSKRMAEYDTARRALLPINPSAGKYVSVMKNSGAKASFYRLFASPLFLKAIDKGFFRPIPRVLRFRLYDFLLTAYSKKLSGLF